MLHSSLYGYTFQNKYNLHDHKVTLTLTQVATVGRKPRILFDRCTSIQRWLCARRMPSQQNQSSSSINRFRNLNSTEEPLCSYWLRPPVVGEAWVSIRRKRAAHWFASKVGRLFARYINILWSEGRLQMNARWCIEDGG